MFKIMTKRQERVAKLISQTVGTLLHDPSVTDTYNSEHIITVTKVEVTPDLRKADIFTSVIHTTGKPESQTETDQIIQQLNDRSNVFRQSINQKIRLKYSPHSIF